MSVLGHYNTVLGPLMDTWLAASGIRRDMLSQNGSEKKQKCIGNNFLSPEFTDKAGVPPAPLWGTHKGYFRRISPCYN